VRSGTGPHAACMPDSMTPGFGRPVLLDRQVQALAAGALVVVTVTATGDLTTGWNIIGDGP
jgi:hypothetical protein